MTPHRHVDLYADDPLAGTSRFVKRLALDAPEMVTPTGHPTQLAIGWASYAHVSEPHTDAECPNLLDGLSESGGMVDVTTVHGIDLTLECVVWRSRDKVSRGHLIGEPHADFALCGIALPLEVEWATASPLGVCESCLKVARS